MVYFTIYYIERCKGSNFTNFRFNRDPSTASKAEYYVQQIGITAALQSFFLMTTDEILYYIFSLVTIFTIILRYRHNDEKKLLSIGACLIIGSLFILMLFFASKSHTPERYINLNPNMMLTPPLVGFIIYKFSQSKKQMMTLLVIGLIIFSLFTTIFSLYQSPLIFRSNDQISTNEVISMNWLLSKKNTIFGTMDIMTPVFRYSDLIFGKNFSLERKDLYRDFNMPNHFGVSNETIPINKDRYMVITEYDVKSYTEVWKDIHKFEKEDFVKINYFKNVNKIYDSKEVNFYLIEIVG